MKACRRCDLFNRCLQTGCVVVNGVHCYQPDGDAHRTYWPLIERDQVVISVLVKQDRIYYLHAREGIVYIGPTL